MDYVEAFAGYNVPHKIKQRAVSISKRFAITGVCDPMYISNVIAHTARIGNGEGLFISDEITNAEDIAICLQGAYGCNIQKSDIPELQRILETGCIEKQVATDGMKAFIKRLESEKKICDEWRVGYLNRTIKTLKENMLEIGI